MDHDASQHLPREQLGFEMAMRSGVAAQNVADAPFQTLALSSVELTHYHFLSFLVLSGLASTFGALGCLGFQSFTEYSRGLAYSLASGLLLSSSYDLIYEGQGHGEVALICGLCVGTLFTRFLQELLKNNSCTLFPWLPDVNSENCTLLLVLILQYVGSRGLSLQFADLDSIALIGFSSKAVVEGFIFTVIFAANNISVSRSLFLVLFLRSLSLLFCFMVYEVLSAFVLWVFPFYAGFVSGSMLTITFSNLVVGAYMQSSFTGVGTVITATVTFVEALRAIFQWANSHQVQALTILEALGWSFLAGLSTGIGGLFVATLGKVTDWWNAFMLGLAAGVMICLSVVDMFLPHVEVYGLLTGLICFAFGSLTLFVLDHLIDYFDLHLESSEEALLLPGNREFSPPSSPLSSSNSHQASHSMTAAQRSRSALLTSIALAAHNAPEGLAVGLTSMTHHASRTLFVVLAMSLHNIPEGLAVAAAIMNATGNSRQAAVIATCSGFAEPIGALLSVSLLSNFLTQRILDYSLMVVGGIMVTVSVKELLPQAARVGLAPAYVGFGCGLVLMYLGIVLLDG